MALLFFIPLMQCENATNAEEPEIQVPDGWTLVWNDEFDKDGLPDAANWGYDTGDHGWGNNERQNYTGQDEETAFVENGFLTVRTFILERPNLKEYRSARLVTKGKAAWKYGRLEIRAKLPEGRGVWPAIWMLPEEWEYGNGGWPDNGEIDIMEYVGYDPGVVHATVHTKARNHILNTQVGEQIELTNPENEFHTYGIEWNADKITGFVDDQVYFEYENEGEGWEYWPFDKPFHIIINTAVGGNWGGQQGVNDDIFPQDFVVDYVRVFKKE